MFYVYDMGIVDFFEGMIELKTYMKLCYLGEHSYCTEDKCNTSKNIHFSYLANLKDFLLKAALALKCTKEWDGDIKEAHISAIPLPTGGVPLLCLVIKQNNDGSSWFITQAKIDFSDHKEWGDIALIHPHKDLNSTELLKYFYECDKLFAKIFNDSMIELQSPENKKAEKAEKADCNIVNLNKVNISDFESA